GGGRPQAVRVGAAQALGDRVAVAVTEGADQAAGPARVGLPHLAGAGDAVPAVMHYNVIGDIPFGLGLEVVDVAGKRPRIPMDDLVRLYRDELLSTKEIARRLGASQGNVYARLKRGGVALRSISESNRLAATQRTPEQRLARSAAAHAAVRGRPADPDRLRAAALTKQRRSHQVTGHGEVLLAGWLRERGLEPVPQMAIDRYNVD